MMAKVPSSARGTPPETGASTKRAPRSRTLPATMRAVFGSIVDMSIQSWPERTAAVTPPSPRKAATTCEDEGSMAMTISPCAVASAAEPAAPAPSVTAALSASGTMS